MEQDVARRREEVKSDTRGCVGMRFDSGRPSGAPQSMPWTPGRFTREASPAWWRSDAAGTYTRGVRRELILRNVICSVADISPSDFDVSGFAERLDLGSGENTIRLENVSVTEWEAVRLQVLPERIQLGFKPRANKELVRGVVEFFLTRLDEVAPEKPVGFNAVVLFTLEDDDDDPSAKLVNAVALAESLGGREGRGGVALIYRDDLSRWWIELSPQPEQGKQWTFDFNRHFEDLPGPGTDRDGLLDWFADIESNMLAQFEIISGGVEQ